MVVIKQILNDFRKAYGVTYCRSVTKVLFEIGLQVGAFSAIYQMRVSKWVSGERIIFLGLLNEERVRALVSGAMLFNEDSEMIVERIEVFTVVSYNFAEAY